MAHCGAMSVKQEGEIANEMSDEAALFFAMTHDLHREYWRSCYEHEHLETNLCSEQPTPEQRVVHNPAIAACVRSRCYSRWQEASKVWFGMENAVRAVAMASAADRALPVLDVGSGNGHMCHLLARAGGPHLAPVGERLPTVSLTVFIRHVRPGFQRIQGMDYCEEAILVAERLRNDYEAILPGTGRASSQPPPLPLEGDALSEGEEGHELDTSLLGIHFVCGDVLDPPYEPELFGLVLDKGIPPR